MHSVFLVCLVGGLGATGLLALFGGIAGHAGHGLSHLHTGHAPPSIPGAHAHVALPSGAHAHAAVQVHSAAAQHPVAGHANGPHAVADVGSQSPVATVLGWTLSLLSPLVIASAALWFGAGGLIADLAVPAASGPVAVVAAVVGAMIVRMLMAAFVRSDTEPLSADATGAVGVLNAPIRPDGLGEVIYVLEGLHRSATARSVDGAPLPRGTNVVIVRRERGIAYVSPLDPLSPLVDTGDVDVLPMDAKSSQVEKGVSE